MYVYTVHIVRIRISLHIQILVYSKMFLPN